MRYLYEEAKRNESEGSDIKFTYSLYLIIELSKNIWKSYVF